MIPIGVLPSVHRRVIKEFNFFLLFAFISYLYCHLIIKFKIAREVKYFLKNILDQFCIDTVD